MKMNARPAHWNDDRVAERSEMIEGRQSSSVAMPFLELGSDFLLLMFGCIAGGTLGHLLQRTTSFSVSPRQLLFGSLIYSTLFITLLREQGAHPRVRSLLYIKETEIALRTAIKAILICLIIFVLARYPVPRMAMLMAWVVSTATLAGGRVWVSDALRKYYAPESPKRRTLIYGTKRAARRFFTGALHSPQLGIDPVGFLASEGETSDVIYSNDYFQRNSRPVFHQPLSIELLEELQINDIVICDPSISDRSLARAKEVAQEANCSFSLVDNHEILTRRSMWVWEMDGLLVATTVMIQPSGLYRIMKRLMDIFCSSILIAMSAPVWAVLALAVRLESKGPIFFRQTRVGQGGKSFEILKFRSMKVDAPKYAFSPAHQADPRITRVGRFLRKSSLDEMPQLINVLKGDMSLVGPRPEMPFITEGYGPVEATRLSVPQGITGLWQLSADRRYAIHESIEYDLYYIQNRTLLMDIAILLHTLVYAAKGV
jgi:exopolysaccharide biosynthesis polyprenyl glycosylphosphotransferase